QITGFDVLPVGSGLPPVLGIPCPPPEVIRYEVGITPSAVYDFRIEATGTDGLYGARCQVETQEQITVAAACAPLSSAGALRVPVEAVLAATGLTCGPEGLSSYVVGLSSQASPPTLDPITSSAIPCDEDARFAPVPPGLYQADVRVPGAPGSAPLATCQGEVIPGATTVATCAAAP
ncbi:MAG TPA: hypothetical protein VLS89_09880, partial [Candidatus Nanopelagicales bacterium]|nr:hypothetical protein [Candidatus Nanopelagicales bacterium]